jgi:four helix bundle protein
MKSFRDLKVWQKAHQLALDTYELTKNFPSEEKFGLSLQMRRATVSIAANIVEGFKRKSDKDYSHFLNMADSSLEETKYYVILSRDLGYIEGADFDKLMPLCEEVGKMLNGLQKKLNS